MHEAQSFAPLLIVVILAFLVPLLLSSLRKRLAIPIVVGEIIAGMIVGNSGLGWVVPENGALELLKQLGFVLLMFLSGMRSTFAGCAVPIHASCVSRRASRLCLSLCSTLQQPYCWPARPPGV